MKKMMFWSHNWYFSVQKALIYYTVNKSHHNSFILLVSSHVANFRYVANFRFLTLTPKQCQTWGLTSYSTARVTLVQALSIALEGVEPTRPPTRPPWTSTMKKTNCIFYPTRTNVKQKTTVTSNRH